VSDNEERIARAERLIADVEARGAIQPCTTCRWVRRSEWFEGNQCTLALIRLQEINPEHGMVASRRCDRERQQNGLCGPQGLYWEAQGIRTLLPRYRGHDFAKIGNWIGLVLVGLLVFMFLLAFLTS